MRVIPSAGSLPGNSVYVIAHDAERDERVVVVDEKRAQEAGREGVRAVNAILRRLAPQRGRALRVAM